MRRLTIAFLLLAALELATPRSASADITGFLGVSPTPSTQFSVTAGGGLFRETLDKDSHTSFGTTIGGGMRLGLAGPLRLRLDCRVFTLRGSPHYKAPQRFYAGANISF